MRLAVKTAPQHSAVADAAHAWSEARADHAVVNFAPPHTPEPLAAIAEALAPLAN